MKFGLICATRGRPRRLEALLDSFKATTSNPALLEFWFGVDDDDLETNEWLDQFSASYPFQVNKISAERTRNLSKDYFNCLAEKAFIRSEFVMAAPDDITMDTEGWDDILRARLTAELPADRILYVGIEDDTPNPPGIPFRSPPYTATPMLSREAWKAQAFGFFHPTILTWGADMTLFMLWSHRLVRRTMAVPEVRIKHHCHHNGRAPQDVINIEVSKRHEGQTAEMDRILTQDVPIQAARIHAKLQHGNVFYCILPERCLYDAANRMSQKVAYRAGVLGYHPIYAEYGRTDATRQAVCLSFLERSKNPTDTLVMLDVDMDHPADIIERLVARNVRVVAPLYFRRGENYEACAFRRNGDGTLHHLAQFPPGLHRMDAIGTGAIAIQRYVLDHLREIGHKWFFQYEYLDENRSPSEDLYFCKLCEKSGIPMYVDTTIESPHITLGFIDRATHDEFHRAYPQDKQPIEPRKEPCRLHSS